MGTGSAGEGRGPGARAACRSPQMIERGGVATGPRCVAPSRASRPAWRLVTPHGPRSTALPRGPRSRRRETSSGLRSGLLQRPHFHRVPERGCATVRAGPGLVREVETGCRLGPLGRGHRRPLAGVRRGKGLGEPEEVGRVSERSEFSARAGRLSEGSPRAPRSASWADWPRPRGPRWRPAGTWPWGAPVPNQVVLALTGPPAPAQTRHVPLDEPVRCRV